MTLETLVREPAGEPRGALVLLHGRGASEHDLFPLLDALDPERRLVGYTPGAPLSLPPGGRHWYRLAGIPTPDPATYLAAVDLAKTWLSGITIPHGRLVLGGFSQGAVMTYALALGKAAAQPAGVIGLSGFLPRVAADPLDRARAQGVPVWVSHGTLDPVIGVEHGRQAAEFLREAGAIVTYRETAVPHVVDPGLIPELARFVAEVTP